MIGISKIFYLLLLFLLCKHSLATEIYKSFDDKGRPIFTDRKLPDTDQQRIQIKASRAEWKRFNIEIIDHDAVLTEREIARIRRDVNTVYSFYDSKMHFDIFKVVPVKIQIFKTQSDYNIYLASRQVYFKKPTRGVYILKNNEIVVWLNPVRWRTFWTIKHEVSHAIVDTLMPYIPSWLNEGMAENMEALGYKDGEFFLNPHKENFRWLSSNKNSSSIKNVSEFLSKTSIKWRKTGANSHAGEFVRMLLSENVSQGFVVRLLHNFERGDNTLSHIHADNLYVGGLRVLQDHWNNWIQRDSSNKVDL